MLNFFVLVLRYDSVAVSVDLAGVVMAPIVREIEVFRHEAG